MCSSNVKVCSYACKLKPKDISTAQTWKVHAACKWQKGITDILVICQSWASGMYLTSFYSKQTNGVFPGMKCIFLVCYLFQAKLQYFKLSKLDCVNCVTTEKLTYFSLYEVKDPHMMKSLTWQHTCLHLFICLGQKKKMFASLFPTDWSQFWK